MATILILDDDDGVGLMIKEVIADQGHQAIRVSKLEDVSPYLRVDAVITDLTFIRVYDRAAGLTTRRTPSVQPRVQPPGRNESGRVGTSRDDETDNARETHEIVRVREGRTPS